MILPIIFKKVGFKANFISGLMMPILNGISDLTYLIIALFGGLQVLAGRLTVGNMQASFNMFGRSTNRFKT